jgi:hypothetical protein
MSRNLPVANSRLEEVQRFACQRVFLTFVFAGIAVIAHCLLNHKSGQTGAA